METRLLSLEDFSPMKAVAALSVLALVGAIAWQNTASLRSTGSQEISNVSVAGRTGNPEGYPNWQRALQDSEVSESAASDPEGLSNIGSNVLGTLVGSYVALKESGTYTPSLGAEVAGTIAENLRADISYRMYTANDIKNDADASLARMLSYRSDLREALAPLLQNTVYELEVFAYYLETKDGRYLDELNDVAQNYRTATESAVKVVVPMSAVAYHVGILNALSEFEAVLQKLATNADDPFASAALIRTLGDAEAHMLLSFEALAGYFRKHTNS